MASHGCKRFIFSSSATVYGMTNKVPFTEEMPAGGCTNPYGWTKFMIEQILRDAAVADPAMSAVLLRYFNPIGAHPSGLMGEDPKGIPNNLLPYVAQVAVGRRDAVHVFGGDYDTPDGTGVRDYIHVMDLASGHVAALAWMNGRTGCEVFNLGTGNGTSVLEIIKAFSAACGRELPYVIEPRRAGDVTANYADCSKAREMLGWEAQYDIADMCRDGWNWQSHNPNGYEG
jgi:UDP-glucose 4-epimerase